MNKFFIYPRNIIKNTKILHNWKRVNRIKADQIRVKTIQKFNIKLTTAMLNRCAKTTSLFKFEPCFYIFFYFAGNASAFIFKGNLFQI